MLSVSCPAEETAPSLKIGSSVTTDVFSELDWVQGEAPKEWEPGKVYIFECWATWCGPCIAAIPHVNELYKKYQPQGLRVFGIDVWEDGRDKVESFVKKKGDGMSYPVAYTGKGGAFELEWLKPAGVKGIPHTFIVRDGKIVLFEHPARITNELIEGLLAGGSEMNEALKDLKSEKEMAEAFTVHSRKFGGAIRSGDLKTAGTSLEKMKEVGKGKESPLHVSMIQWSIANEDWETAETLLGSVPDERYEASAYRSAVMELIKFPEPPQPIMKVALEGYQKAINSRTSREGPNGHKYASILLWKLGEKEMAIAEARKGEEMAGTEIFIKLNYFPGPFQKLAESMEQGELPSVQTIEQWSRTARQNKVDEGKAEPKSKTTEN